MPKMASKSTVCAPESPPTRKRSMLRVLGFRRTWYCKTWNLTRHHQALHPFQSHSTYADRVKTKGQTISVDCHLDYQQGSIPNTSQERIWLPQKQAFRVSKLLRESTYTVSTIDFR